MANKQHAAFLLALVLLLSACAQTDSAADTTAPVTGSTAQTLPTQGSSAPTDTQPTQPVPEMTRFSHSALYLPDYSTGQITEYFEEVVLSMEFSDDTGNPHVVQKWLGPLYYRIYGEPTDEDIAVLEALFAQLNEIPGFPGIYAAPDDVPENLTLGFWEPDAFWDLFSEAVRGEDANGAAQFWYYTETNELHTARIGYRTDLDQSVRNSILLEEIINTLGINDTELRPDSIVYQYSDDNLALSDVDWVILRLLYDPAIRCGMDAADCAEVIAQLYH